MFSSHRHPPEGHPRLGAVLSHPAAWASLLSSDPAWSTPALRSGGAGLEPWLRGAHARRDIPFTSPFPELGVCPLATSSIRTAFLETMGPGGGLEYGLTVLGVGGRAGVFPLGKGCTERFLEWKTGP